MSYMVKRLMNERLAIRENYDIEDELFGDLLVVEKAIEHLFQIGVLTEQDVKLLYTVGEKPTWQEVGEYAGIERTITPAKFREVCEVVGNFLGDDFRDEVLIARLTQEHNLTPEQVERLKKEINAK